jgi:hypothetical protein
MTIASAFRKCRAIAGAQQRLTTVFHEHQFALDDENEFILVTVPVALAGPSTGRQRHEVDAEVTQAPEISQALSRTRCAGSVEWRWISGTLSRRDGGNVDFGHGQNLSRSPVMRRRVFVLRQNCLQPYNRPRTRTALCGPCVT